MMETIRIKDGPRGNRGRSRVGAVHALVVAACALGLMWPPQGLRAQDAAEVVREVQRRYDATREYSARFRQTTEYRTLNRRVDYDGRFFFSKPAKMLWRYREPAGQFVLSDGKHLYFYQPAEQQIIKTALGAVFRSDLPLSFLLGLGDLGRDFRADSLETGEAGHRLMLSPRKANTGLQRIQLLVDPASYDIRQVSIEDGAGNRWTFAFDDVRRGERLDPSLFVLEVPQGVDIVEFGS